MADRRGRLRSPVLKIRTSSARLIRPDELGAKIENMYPTEEGTLRAIWGPTPYVPKYLSAGAPPSAVEATANAIPQIYGATHGICHASLDEGQREVILVHTGSRLWSFEGWDRGWHQLIGASNGFVVGDIPEALDNSGRAQFPTQFVVTPTGVVIVPQSRRAYFYDGEVILPLGYDRAPSSPAAMGPESSEDQIVHATPLPGINDIRYAHDALTGRISAMHPVFKHGRLGLVVSPTNFAADYDKNHEGDARAVIMAWLEPGEWRARVQWIDRWGNVSPLSEPSEPVQVERQPATGYAAAATFYVRGELVRKQFAWMGIPRGPDGTIGRILCRTRDLKQTGDTRYYEIPLDARSTSKPFATLPDNTTQLFPDNVPDSWLFREPLDVDPVPEFKVAALGFGRLWIGNVPGAPGLIRPSELGRWGTFPKGLELYPDPSAAGITGLCATTRGLLAFTETSTYSIESNADGDGFRSSPLSTTIGCAAPSSLVTLPDGTVVWLGRDGFYAYGGGQIQYIFADLRKEAREFTESRLVQAVAAYDPHAQEYRCWLSVHGSVENNRCYIYDGEGWRRRTDVNASGVCVTRDYRAHMIACGKVDDEDGVWLLDHQTNNFTPEARTYTIETGWLSSADSQERISTSRIILWLRDTLTTVNDPAKKIQVDVYRDWREHATQTATALPFAPDDFRASYWGEEIGTTKKWVQRRPYWTKVDIDVRSAEVFKLRLRSQHPFEFIGLQFESNTPDSGGAKTPP